MTPPPADTPSREERINEAIAAYLRAAEAGQPPHPDHWLAQHADLADELRSFLADRAEFRRRAEELPAAPPAGNVAEAATIPPGPAPTDAKLGTVRYFGDYELLEEIARGGMGVVFKARQVSLNRVVALKMILAGQLASADDVQRFRREAEAAAGLDHPHIVPIYEVGEHDGQQYFSMKLVEGSSLSYQLPAMQDDPKAAARLVAGVARAVHYAHQRGILHRDLKPANILLDGDNQPHVTDFGLAKRIAGDSKLTQSGAIVGTPSYMAPEQAGGKKGLTVAADVYSLGAILYECLTGRPPFQATTPLDTLLEVLEKEPERPRLLNSRLSRDLETICLKCLHKEPERRYGSALELTEDLERYLRGDAIRARQVGRLERTWRWGRRNPAVAALTVATVLLLLSGTAISGYFAIQASQRADEAEDRASEARTEKNRADRERLKAVKEKNRADAERDGAVKSEFAARQYLYVAQVNQAHLAWQTGQVGRMEDLLEATLPAHTGGHDFRGFEWYYLQRLSNGALHTLRHDGPVTGIAFNHDGKRLASVATKVSKKGVQGTEITLWDLEKGKPTHRLPIAWASSVAFSPDGKLVAAGTKVWEAATAKEICTLPIKAISLGVGEALAFHPQGQRIAVITGKTVQLFSALNGQEEGPKFQPHKLELNGVAFSPDGQRLAAGSTAQMGGFFQSRTVIVWDVKSGKQLKTFAHPNGVLGVAFSPKGDLLASAGGDLTVRVWDIAQGTEKRLFQGHTSLVQAVAFSPDGKHLVSTSWDQMIRVWEVATGKELGTFKGHTAQVLGVAFSKDGKRLASASADKTVRVWDFQKDQDALTLRESDPVICLAFPPDGKHVALGTSGVTLRDASTGKAVRFLKNPVINLNTVCMAFSQDGSRLAYPNMNEIQIWDIKRARKLTGIKHQHLIVWSLTFNPEGTLLAIPSAEGVTIVNVATGKKVRTLSKQGGFTMAISPDGKYLSSPGDDYRVRVSDFRTGKVIHTLTGHPGPVFKLAFRAKGKQLVSASESKVIIWDLATGQEIRQFPLASSKDPINPRFVNAMNKFDFSPDGNRLAVIRGDGTVKLWDLATGQQTLSLQGPPSLMLCVAFSPDGRRLGVGSFDANRGNVRIWDAPP
jgi:WD40 repeat protein